MSSILSKADVSWTDGVWERRDYPTIMSGPVVRYTLVSGGNFEVSASRDAVFIDCQFASDECAESVSAIIARATRQWKHMREWSGLRSRDPLPEVDAGAQPQAKEPQI